MARAPRRRRARRGASASASPARKPTRFGSSRATRRASRGTLDARWPRRSGARTVHANHDASADARRHQRRSSRVAAMRGSAATFQMIFERRAAKLRCPRTRAARRRGLFGDDREGVGEDFAGRPLPSEVPRSAPMARRRRPRRPSKTARRFLARPQSRRHTVARVQSARVVAYWSIAQRAARPREDDDSSTTQPAAPNRRRRSPSSARTAESARRRASRRARRRHGCDARSAAGAHYRRRAASGRRCFDQLHEGGSPRRTSAGGRLVALATRAACRCHRGALRLVSVAKAAARGFAPRARRGADPARQAAPRRRQ